MIASYALDPTLYGRCMALIEACFPGIKAIADDGSAHNAYWDKNSTPFVIEQDKEIIAHLGAIPFEMILNSQPVRALAFHGICVKESQRRCGYFKTLMTEALSYMRANYDFGFLFTDKPHLYESFGFKVVPEQDAIFEKVSKKLPNALRKLDLDVAQDLALLHQIVSARLPVSKRFGIIKETTVLTLNVLQDNVFYAVDADLLIVYEILRDCLVLKDVISTHPYPIEKVCDLIPESFSKVICQFSLDLPLESYALIKAMPECALMVTTECEIGSGPFRYPQMYRC